MVGRIVTAAIVGGWLYGVTMTPAAASPQVAEPLGPAPAPQTPKSPAESPQPTAVDKGELAALRQQLEETNKKLAAVQQQMQQILELLNGRSGASPVAGLIEDVRQLRSRLNELEADLNKLRGQYQALSPARPANPASPASPAAPLTGRGVVRIVNDFPAEITMVVNGATYRVLPRQTVSVEVPAGEFTYQLVEGGGTLVRKPIREQETVTLRVH